MISRRAQEEIVGFVLVILLVSVVFLVFLGISFRSDSSVGQESIEIYQFLESVMEHTSECAIGFEPDFSSLGELLEECNEGRRCVNGKDACDVLNESLRSVLDASWNIGPEATIKGYEFSSVYSESEIIVSFTKGECGGRFRGSEYLKSEIVSSLKICF
jgi:hypothetical protein